MYSEKLNNLIITADDFGISQKANQAIFDLLSRKKIDRVAVMMGAFIKKEDVEKLIASGVKIDIHLHLLSRKYFLEREGEGDRQVLRRVFLHALDYLSGNFTKGKIKLLWKKQIDDFLKVFGRLPDGINSHEHLHFFPPFFRAALYLKRKYGISYLRLGKLELDGKFGPVAWILRKFRSADIRFNRIMLAPPDIIQNFPFVLNTSDYFLSFDWIKNPEVFFENLPEIGQTELVFHPEREEERKFLEENFNVSLGEWEKIPRL